MDRQDLFSVLKLDRSHPTPLYYQLEGRLAQLIEEGALKPGDKIPGDVAMSQALKLNNRTVRQALGRLATRGLIRRVRRAGTFVTQREPSVRDTVGFFYFEENATQMLQCADAIQRYAMKHGVDLKMAAFPKTFYRQTDLLEHVRSMALKGLVIVPLNDEDCARNLLRLEQAAFPYVRLGNAFFQGRVHAPLVRGDWPRAIRHALHHLWALGHRRIGFISNVAWTGDRMAYSDFARAHGAFPERWALTIESDGTLEMLHQLPTTDMLGAYLDRNPELTAICAPILGLELTQVASARNRPVPDALSVMGFGTPDSPHGPLLSTMRSDFRLMGESAAHKLFEQIVHGVAVEEEVIFVPMDLVAGDTVAAPLMR